LTDAMLALVGRAPCPAIPNVIYGVVMRSLPRTLLSGLIFCATLSNAAFARDIVHYQKNILANAADYDALAKDILTVRPDTVSLQEVSLNDTRILDLLKDAYPFQQYCPVSFPAGVAVLSRWPIVESSRTCFDGWGIAGFQVDLPDGRAWVLSAHVQVFFHGHRDVILQHLLPELRTLAGPVIMAGDFNSQPTATSTQLLAKAAGAQRIGQPVQSFFMWDWYGVAIDHIMATGGIGQIEQRPRFGSDHMGVLGSFTMSPQIAANRTAERPAGVARAN
jgi:endonuclease/exonuclease/phosphatase (EEP) superfamily protein YafD